MNNFKTVCIPLTIVSNSMKQLEIGSLFKELTYPLEAGLSQCWEMGFEIFHDKNRRHYTLVIAIHHTTERCKETGHEDIRITHHTDHTGRLVGIGSANSRLADLCLMDADHCSDLVLLNSPG